MPQLIVTVGLPASGKTTYAEKHVADNRNCVNVNRDDLRRMLKSASYGLDQCVEREITVIQRNIVSGFIDQNYDVIVSDTNLNTKTFNIWKREAERLNAVFVVKSFLDVPVEVCIERDRNRQHSVGEAVIIHFYNKYIKNGVFRYE